MASSDARYDTVRPLFHLRNAESGMFNLSIDLVRRRSDGLFCVKKVIAANDVRNFRANREADLLLQLKNNVYINRLIELETAGHGSNVTVALFLEYCDQGALQGVLRRTLEHGGPRLPEAFVWHVFKSMAKALSYLHYGIKQFTRGAEQDANWDFVLHRDIKPHNIFLKTSHEPLKPYPRVVLGDFGCAISSSLLGQRDILERRASRLTPAFMPPEHPRYTRKSDIWALATVVLDILGVNRWDRLRQRLIWNPDLTGCGYSPELVACVRYAGRIDARERPAAPELVVELADGHTNAVQRGLVPSNPEPLELWRFTDGEEPNPD